jgi:hypothetical protein
MPLWSWTGLLGPVAGHFEGPFQFLRCHYFSTTFSWIAKTL